VISGSDERIHLAKACLLMGLEEDAAKELHPELREVFEAQPWLPMRTFASASTWSLERLDSLAAEVLAEVARALPLELPQAPLPPSGRSSSSSVQHLPPGLFVQHPHAVLAALNTVLFDR
jgi:hypothetical protein